MYKTGTDKASVGWRGGLTTPGGRLASPRTPSMKPKPHPLASDALADAVRRRDGAAMAKAVTGPEEGAPHRLALAAGACCQGGWADGFDAMLDAFVRKAGARDTRAALLLDEAAGWGFVHGCRRLLGVLPAWLRPPLRQDAITAAVLNDSGDCLAALLDASGQGPGDFEYAFACARRHRSRTCLTAAARRARPAILARAIGEMAEVGAWEEADAVACGAPDEVRNAAVEAHGLHLPRASQLTWQWRFGEGGEGGGRRRA